MLPNFFAFFTTTLDLPLIGFGFGMPGPFELLIIGLIVLLLFGNRLPSTMRSLGKSITEFKKGINNIEEDVDKAVERKSEEEKPVG